MVFGRSRLALVICGLALATSSGVAGLQRPRDSTPRISPKSSFTPIDVKAIVDKYCVTCHNERSHSGGMVLETVDFANAAAHAESLEKVVRKLGTGAMPPLGMPRPDQATYDALVSWIAGELDRTVRPPDRIPVRPCSGA